MLVTCVPLKAFVLISVTPSGMRTCVALPVVRHEDASSM